MQADGKVSEPMVVRHWRQEWRYQADAPARLPGQQHLGAARGAGGGARRRVGAERLPGRRLAALRRARALAAQRGHVDLDQRRDLAAAAAARVQRAQGLRRAGRHQPPHHHADRLGAGREQPQARHGRQPLPGARVRRRALRAHQGLRLQRRPRNTSRAPSRSGPKCATPGASSPAHASPCAASPTRRSSSCRSSSTPRSWTKARAFDRDEARAFVKRTLQERYLAP